VEIFNKETMEFLKYAKIALAVLLLLCLFHWPYGYYMFIRFVTMVVFAVMAFDYFGKKNIPLCIVSVAIAVLFNPFVKICLGRTMWNVADVVVAVLLIGMVVGESRKD
jgi:hypothetical protein